MALDKNTVDQIATLARLSVDADDNTAYQDELGQILALVDQLDAAATRDVAPLAHPLELTARMRADEVSETDRREAYQAIAPAVANGYYLVPKVID